MRMWMIDPELLCDKHLLGEHVECHMLVGSTNKGKNLDGFIYSGLVEIHHLKDRHKRLAVELNNRGFNHNSELPEINFPIDLFGGLVDIEKNIEELALRCCRCKSKIDKIYPD